VTLVTEPNQRGDVRQRKAAPDEVLRVGDANEIEIPMGRDSDGLPKDPNQIPRMQVDEPGQRVEPNDFPVVTVEVLTHGNGGTRLQTQVRRIPIRAGMALEEAAQSVGGANVEFKAARLLAPQATQSEQISKQWPVTHDRTRKAGRREVVAINRPARQSNRLVIDV
jgi:hypothetical protein